MAEKNIIPNQTITAFIPLTAAQVNASFTTPITLIEKKGANFIIWVKSCTLQYKATAATPCVGGNNSVVRYKSGSTICAQDFNGLTATTFYAKNSLLSSATATQADANVEFGTLTANPTLYGGVDVILEYQVISLT